MKVSGSAPPFAISVNFCSHSAVSMGEVSGSGRTVTRLIPAFVGIRLLPLRSTNPAATSFSMIAALVAGVPSPFRSASSGISSLPLLRRFVKGKHGYVSACFLQCFFLNDSFQPILGRHLALMIKKDFYLIRCLAQFHIKTAIRHSLLSKGIFVLFFHSFLLSQMKSGAVYEDVYEPLNTFSDSGEPFFVRNTFFTLVDVFRRHWSNCSRKIRLSGLQVSLFPVYEPSTESVYRVVKIKMGYPRPWSPE